MNPSPSLDMLIRLLGRLPGLGPRSARRVALHLLNHRESLLLPLAQAMVATHQQMKPCHLCGNLDDASPCRICTDPKRDGSMICVVESLSDLWALERGAIFRGHYHILGGTLSALDGRGPDSLSIAPLLERAASPLVKEVILATNATVEGQTTAHYISEKLIPLGVSVSRLAQGIPIGGELDYLDEGTLSAALRQRLTS